MSRRGWALALGALVAVVTPSVALSAASSAAGAPGAVLGHAGRWITDPQGRVVILHGVNKGDKDPPYDPAAGLSDAGIATLAAEGFNVLRLGVEHDGLEPRPGHYDDAYVARIVDFARRLVAHGIAPIIDFHQDQYGPALNGNGIARWATIDDGLPHVPDCGFGCTQLVQPALNRAFDHFWANDHLPGDPIGLQDHVARADAHLAAALRGVDGLLGYEILNEPWPGTVWPTCAVPTGCPLFERGALDAFDNRVAAALRAADGRHLIFYEPQTTFNDGVATFAGPLPDPAHQAGFAFHDYCLLGSADTNVERPGGPLVCPLLEQRVLDNAVAHVATTGEALLMTEFGATTLQRPVREIADGADRGMIPWIWWEYNEAFQPNLGLLVRAYPRAVAGVPRAWFFDVDTKTFDLTYATVGAAGERLAPGLRTEVFVPRLQYPGGYRVTANGARVVSAPNAALLELVNRPGAATVTVRVTPR